MKAVILAAGYATRLYPLTENFPKPLLKIGDGTILGRLMDDISAIPGIDSSMVVTNHRFAGIFREWAGAYPGVRILDDGSTCNENRLGAVKDLLLAISAGEIDDDILVLAADNILDFSLRGFVDFFRAKDASCIMCHYEPSIKKLRRTGVVALGEDSRVLQMQEKPSEPVSHWAVPPFYIYARHDLPLIKTAMDGGCGFDAPGNLAHYLVDKTAVYAWEMPGARFDIGSLDTYREAQLLFGGDNKIND